MASARLEQIRDGIEDWDVLDVVRRKRGRAAPITACGLAQGSDLATTVMPFILRGVSLLGIDSVMCPKGPRIKAWDRLARDLDPALISVIGTEVGLSEAIQAGHDIGAGKIRGRVLVDVNR